MAEEARNKILESPLNKFVSRWWRKLSQDVSFVQVRDTDFVLYLIWTLDTIKSQSGDNGQFRDLVYGSLRDNFIVRNFTSNKEDILYLTNLVCAASMACLGLVLKGNIDMQSIYTEIIRSFGDYRKDIDDLENRMNVRIEGLQDWLTEYFDDENFYTYDDSIDWDNNIMAERLIKLSSKFKKIDLYRVIMALYQIGAFESIDGSELLMKDVYSAFGDMLGEDFSKYEKNLSNQSTNKNPPDIFSRLEAGFEKYEVGKDNNLKKQGKPIRR